MSPSDPGRAPRRVSRRLTEAYARDTVTIGGVLLLIVPILAPPGPIELVAAVVGVVAVALLRLGAIPASRFSYLTMTVVPVGALSLLGYPTAAVLSAGVGTLLADLTRRSAWFAAPVNAGRETITAAAALGVFFLLLRIAGVDWSPGEAPGFLLESLPAVAGYFVAYLAVSRGLFYFSLAYRGKLERDEWGLLFRYETVAAGLGIAAAWGAGAAVAFLGDTPAWVMVIAFIVAAGLIARELVAGAIASEELRKVMAMETVISVGRALEDTLRDIVRIAYRTIDWRWLRIYLLQEGRLVPVITDQRVRPPSETEAGAARARALEDRETVVSELSPVWEGEPGDRPVRSLVTEPLRYGDETLGILELGHSNRGAYGAGGLRLIDRFGRQLALALQLDGLIRPMVGAARKIDTQLAMLGQTAAALRASGEDVAGHSASMREGVAEQRDRTVAGRSATRSVAGAAAEIATDADDVASRSREAGQLAAGQREEIAEAIERLVELRDFVDGEARQVEELAATSKRISGVVRAVREIAEQTQLLALNAAIEAARAGEHGRGFAVVASEVRKLADSSARATDEASSLLARVRSEVAGAVQRMREGARRVSDVGRISDTASTGLERIVRSFEGVGELSARIAARVGEQREALAGLQDEIARVSQIAEANGVGADKVAEAARAQAGALGEIEEAATSLRAVAEELNRYMHRFAEG